MDKETYQKIEDTLMERVNLCYQYIGMIDEDHPLENITLKQALEAKEFCKAEKVKQTNILMVDLYHLIGMGNLSAVQLGKINKLIKEYCSYRPDIKAISFWDGNIEHLPKIPKKTKFKLLEFDLELVNGRGGEVEEEVETIYEYTETKKEAQTQVKQEELSQALEDLDNNDLCPHAVYRVADKAIEIEKGYQLQVAEWMCDNLTYFKCINAGNLAAAMTSNKTKFGILWQKMSNGKIIGTIESMSSENLVPMCLDNFKNV